MNSFKENQAYKMLNETKYLSKNDIIKKFNKIKGTINKLTKNASKSGTRNKFNKINDMGKKNLTCLNFYNSNYKDNNFYENKIKFSAKKLKQDLLFDYTEYSSFISRNSKLLNSEFPITGIYTPRKTLNEMKLKRFLSAKAYNIDISDDRTKSSTSKNTKTKRSNKLMLTPYSAKVNINFIPNYNRLSLNNLLKTSFSKYRREDITSFMEKTRMIRREKYIKLKLQNKMQYEREMNKEKINIIDTNKQEYFNNLSLLNKFDKTFNDYIKQLELERIKETQVNAQLCKRKVELEISIQKLQKEVNKLKIKLKRYQSFKEFLLLVKYGSDALKNNKEKSKEKEKEKEKVKEKEKEKEKKGLDIIVSMTENSDNNEKRKDTSAKPNKNRHRKSVCIDIENIKKTKLFFPYFINVRKKSSRSTKREKTSITKVNTLIGKKDSSTLIQDLNNSPIFKNEDEFENIFSRVENLIINDLDYLTSQKKIVYQRKNNLEKVNNESNNNKNYILIESKEKMLEFEKKENEKLKRKLELIIQNNSMKKSLKNNLEKKIGKMLFKIFEKIGDKKKFDMKELVYILKMDKKEFYNKKLFSKILYMIKMIELAASYLIDSINKFKDNPKLQDIFKIIEKEKNKKLHFLKMEQLRKNLEDKKENILKRSAKIYFLSRSKYDANNIKKNNKKLIKKNVIKRNKSNDSIEKWLSYD